MHAPVELINLSVAVASRSSLMVYTIIVYDIYNDRAVPVDGPDEHGKRTGMILLVSTVFRRRRVHDEYANSIKISTRPWRPQGTLSDMHLVSKCEAYLLFQSWLQLVMNKF